MADEKQIIIGSRNGLHGVLRILYGTGVKESPDVSNADSISTFSGAIVQGTDTISYTLEIEKLRYENMEMHQKLSEKLEYMMRNPEPITVIDTIRPKGEAPYQVKKMYKQCIVSGNDYEMKPDEHTAESLKFTCASRTSEWKQL